MVIPTCLAKYGNHGPFKPTCLEVFMVNNRVFRWPETFTFHGFRGLMECNEIALGPRIVVHG